MFIKEYYKIFISQSIKVLGNIFVNKINRFVLLLFLLLGLPPVVNANAGVPMLFVVYPGFLLFLVPIVFIESFYIKYKLGLNSLMQAFNPVLIGNLVSTLVGIPLTWLAGVVVQMCLGGGSGYAIDTFRGKIYAGIVQAPWLIPYEDAFIWLIPTAFTVLMIYFFLASWLIEYLIVWLFFKKKYEKALIRKVVFKANLISYLFLYTAAMIFLAAGGISN